MTIILQLLAIAFYAIIFVVMAWAGYKKLKSNKGCDIYILVDKKTGLEYFLTETGGICPRMTVNDAIKTTNAANDFITVLPFVGKVQ